MKNLIILAALLLPFAAQAKDINEYEPQGSETIAVCGSGDAIGGVQLVRGASKKLYIEISSMEDGAKPQVFFSEDVKSNERSVRNIRASRLVQLVFRSDDSFDFGGATTKATLLNIKAGKKDTSGYNSLLALDGQVINLNCSLKKGE
jgi:hypothetical protein